MSLFLTWEERDKYKGYFIFIPTVGRWMLGFIQESTRPDSGCCRKSYFYIDAPTPHVSTCCGTNFFFIENVRIVPCYKSWILSISLYALKSFARLQFSNSLNKRVHLEKNIFPLRRMWNELTGRNILNVYFGSA